jgi:hypothetical protein
MEQMATNGDRSPQQQQEFYHWLRPERATNRMGTSPSNRITLGVEEPNRRRIPV